MFFCKAASAQKPALSKIPADSGIAFTSSRFRVSDTIPESPYIAFPVKTFCKRVGAVFLVNANPMPASHVQAIVAEDKPGPWLKITGNILYDVNYRSRIDTPYVESNVYQHTVQTRIDAVLKERYPFRIYLTTRFSNSDLFRKYTDFNFQFNQADFQRQLRQRAAEVIQAHLAKRSTGLDSLEARVKQLRESVAGLLKQNAHVDPNQALVEAREELLYSKQQPIKRADAEDRSIELIEELSDDQKFSVRHKWRRALGSRVDSLGPGAIQLPGSLETMEFGILRNSISPDSVTRELARTESLLHSLQSATNLNAEKVKRQIMDARSGTELLKKLREAGVPDTLLPRGYRTLLAVRQLSLGRSTADYSELTVRNISITGLQVEYNPNYYYAVAAGRVDYRFRDYIVPASNRSNQFLALVRWGKGTRQGAHIFFTYYTGKRQFFNSVMSNQPNTVLPEYKLAGMALEGQLQLGKNLMLVGEIAKSTLPFYGRDSILKKRGSGAMTDIKDRTNEAYSLRAVSFISYTNTRISGSVRYTAANFQSFSTYTTGAAQMRWQAKVEQPFFKKQLSVVSSLQQNDYSNPFVMTTYKSSSLLASVQATFRRRKWPVISAGYYPSYQLIKVGDDQFSESRYYTLTGSVGHHYQVKSAQLSSYLVYSKFYNSSNDSGFIYYNSRNWLFSQNLLLNNWSLTGNGSLSLSADYNLAGVEANGQLVISKWLSAGAGVKTIKHSSVHNLFWGYSGSVGLKIARIGDLQLMFDKGFIPGINRTLIENNLGRVTYYKTF